MLKRSIIGLAAVAAATASPAFAAPATPAPSGASTAGDTVNSYTPAEERRARAAATRQGYRVGVVTTAQAGVLFFSATKGGQGYQLTVTPEGQVYASSPVTATAAAGPAQAPARR